MKLIDKDALVAEIEKWRDGIKKGIFSIPLTGSDKACATFEYEILGKIKDFLDTLEVKEIEKNVWKDNFELPQENIPIIACCIGDTLVIQGIFKIINKGYKSETYRISSYGWDVVKKMGIYGRTVSI